MLQSLLMLSYVGFNNESRAPALQWTSLSLLCMYYRREIERSLHQCGQWSVKDEYSHLKREPSLLPYIDIAPSPEKIVAVVRRGIAVQRKPGYLWGNYQFEIWLLKVLTVVPYQN